MIKISIIVPVYNVEKYLYRCLESTQNQNVPVSEYEVVVINDGSQDNSLKIAEIYASTHINVRVISQKNRGLSAARNNGIENAKGEYLFFLDSDDWIAENCLDMIFKRLNAEKPDVLRICSANVINGVPVRRDSYVGWKSMTGRDALRKGISPCAPFSIVKRDFLNRFSLRFCEGIFHEDSEMTPRMHYLVEKMSFINDVIYFVFQNPNSITRTINPKRSFDLVNVVCKNLSEFSKSVSSDYVQLFDDMISMYINNALSYILDSDKEKQKELDYSIFNNQELLNHLSKASLIKYQIEAFLFKLFPKHYVRVYKLMKWRF